jgi:curved DNA-binding protein CbpA
MTSKSLSKIGKKTASRLNPDDKEAERKFKELNEANEVLSNPENRKSMINTENTGNMVKNMKKLSSSKDNIKVRAREISVADFPVLILVKEDFSDFSRVCSAEQEEVSAGVQEEVLPENLKDRIFRQN